MAFVVREIQPTPNPNAMKFVLDKPIANKTVSFFNVDQARGHALGTQLLTIPGVSNVMLFDDFVTIGKLPDARWSQINGKVKEVLSIAN